MKAFAQITSLFILASASLVAPAAVSLTQRDMCATCNPVAGQNWCDITTSCINTGTEFHCACRAGYKASQADTDVTQEFRLPMPHYEFLVFVPPGTACNTLCNNPYGGIPTLCSEVTLYNNCAV